MKWLKVAGWVGAGAIAAYAGMKLLFGAKRNQGDDQSLAQKSNITNAEISQAQDIEYIVVGSGAGGGPLACNLAKAGYKVLLFEAGGEDENYNYQVPCFHGLATEDEAYKWDYFVKHYENDEQQRRDSKFDDEYYGIYYPRAATLGGCTSHNAMITVYPHNSDWDEIADLIGDVSWHSSNMRKYFERLERCRYADPSGAHFQKPIVRLFYRLLYFVGLIPKNPSRHGFDGWLTTELADPRLALKDPKTVEIILEAAREAFRDDPTPLKNLISFFDPNDWRAVIENADGLVLTPLATNRGWRNGSREYIRRIQHEHPDRLLIKTGALVTKVLFDDNKRAIGVEYLEGRHLYRADPRAGKDSGELSPPQKAYVKREVILSAGAFNTPQILKLSGVGPREELENFGIQVVADLPGVGENLQDRYEVGVITEMKENFALLKDATFISPKEGEKGDPCFIEWHEQRKGVYTTNGVLIGMIKRSLPNKEIPDLYIFGVPGYFKGYYPGYSQALQHYKNIFTWAILKAHTNNTAGRVTLKSADPLDTPDINFRYFEEGNDASGEDLEAVAAGVEFVRRMNKLVDINKKELLPGPEVQTREQIKEFIKNEAWGHHASCTCKIGKPDDPMAVLDGNFQVYGTKNLRVVDASVFPRIPGFFIVTAIYMISEKASDVIIAEARKFPRLENFETDANKELPLSLRT